MKSLIAAMAAMVVLSGCSPGDVYEYEVVMRNGVTNVVEAETYLATSDIHDNLKSVVFKENFQEVARFGGDILYIRRGKLVRSAFDRTERRDRR